MVDLILHACVAIWVHFNFNGIVQQPFFWLCIVLAFLANLLSIVVYIARSIDREPPATGLPQLSDFQRRLSERPEECVVLLMLGLMNTEWLCFLTTDERAHTSFRKMSLLSSVIEDVPTLLLQISFLYDHNWSGLIAVSFAWTVATLLIKLLRGWILLLTSSCETPAKLGFSKNLRCNDLLAFPVFLIHIVAMIIFLIFADYAAHMPRFAQDWLLLQLETTLGGSLNTTLRESVLADDEACIGLVERANLNTTTASCANLTLELVVRRVLLPQAVSRDDDRSLLTQGAVVLLDALGELQRGMGAYYSAGVVFVVGGVLCNLVLITLFMRHPAFTSSFVTQRLWRSSLTASLIATFGLGNATFLNGKCYVTTVTFLTIFATAHNAGRARSGARSYACTRMHAPTT